MKQRYIYLIALFFSFFLACGTTEETPANFPVPGNNGELSITDITYTSMKLTWQSANDVETLPENIQYKVVLSVNNNIDTVEKAEANGTVIRDWSTNITPLPVSNLSPSTTYYFNIIVQDDNQNKALYTTKTASTLVEGAPMPGGGGKISIANITVSSVKVSWQPASDDVTATNQLQYLVYYSTTDQFNSVANIELHGTPFGSYQTAITQNNITGLQEATKYYLTVMVKDLSSLKSAYLTTNFATKDITPPVTGNNGALVYSGITSSSATINWSKATDNLTEQSKLQYRLYYATSPLPTISAVQSGGTAVGGWSADISSLPVSGLFELTTYHFNLLVVDEAGNTNIYAQTNLTTPDGTPPTAGNSGTLTTSGVTANQISLNWTAATDNHSAQSTLQYLVYYSINNNISSVNTAEANGTAVGSYSANITTKSITALSEATTYYLTVIVKDEAGNKTIYTTKTQATADETAPTISNSTLQTLRVKGTSARITWTQANDNFSSQANLNYQVYYSTANNISTLSDISNNGTLGYSGTGSAYGDIIGLSAETSYYFNVMVSDEAGNASLYTTVNRKTADANDNYLVSGYSSFETGSTNNTFYRVNCPNWQRDWSGGSPGILTLYNPHRHSGTFGVYFYTGGGYSGTSFCSLTGKGNNIVPWNEGEAALSWIWVKTTSPTTLPAGFAYLNIMFLNQSGSTLAQHQVEITSSDISGATWRNDLLRIITPAAPTGTKTAKIRFGLYKASGNSSQLKISMDDAHIGVYSP